MKILRLNNDLCELAEIDDELEDLQAEVGGRLIIQGGHEKNEKHGGS